MIFLIRIITKSSIFIIFNSIIRVVVCYKGIDLSSINVKGTKYIIFKVFYTLFFAKLDNTLNLSFPRYIIM